MKKIPFFTIVSQLERLSARKVRIGFTDGAVIEMLIPVQVAKRIRIIDQGLAVKFGSGPMSEISAWTLRERAGRVIAIAPRAPKLFPGQVHVYAKKRSARS